MISFYLICVKHVCALVCACRLPSSLSSLFTLITVACLFDISLMCLNNNISAHLELWIYSHFQVEQFAGTFFFFHVQTLHIMLPDILIFLINNLLVILSKCSPPLPFDDWCFMLYWIKILMLHFLLKIAVTMVNARMSVRSFNNWLRPLARPLISFMLSNLALIAPLVLS